MHLPRKIGFVSVISSASVQRLMRGALTYANLNPHLSIRDFRLSAGIVDPANAATELAALNRWEPDGLLTYLDDQEFKGLFEGLAAPPPMVSFAGISLRPGVAMVGSSMSRLVEVAAQHFRQLGLRSMGLLVLERNPGFQQRLADSFVRFAKPPDPELATHIEPIDPDFLADVDKSVEPVPRGIVQWLDRLPKPAGLMSMDHYGGNYIVRVCQALGLRVPEDIAVIGVDDVDLCLSSVPTLTSVEPATEIIGFEGMKTLDGMLQGKMPEKLNQTHRAVDLHVRQSTGQKNAEVCDIAGAMDYINRHACYGLTVERLIAETQRVSKMTFHKHFVAAIGKTPGEAIRQRQLAEARRLLADTTLSITLVAEQSGFGSSSDFARAFRSAEGMTPRAYREQAGPA